MNHVAARRRANHLTAALVALLLASAFVVADVGPARAAEDRTISGQLILPAGADVSNFDNLDVYAEGDTLGDHVYVDAASDGTLACDSGTQDLHVDASGHFIVTLPDACATQVAAKPNLWSDVVVDGNSLGRAKIGAVPYAIEAKHATSADGAAKADTAGKADTATKASDPASGGSIETRLAALEALPKALSTVFRTSIAASDGVHAESCIAGPSVVSCAVAAGRKCTALGYAEGWFEGESGDGVTRTIVCIK